MKIKYLDITVTYKTILKLILFNLAIWTLSAIFDYFFGNKFCNYLCYPQMYHSEEIGFVDVFILNIPPMLLFHRILIMMIFYFLTVSIYLLFIFRKLKKSEKELQLSNNTKNKLFGIIAHDLRSPFNGLIGLSKILVDEHKDLKIEELQEISENILKGTKQLYNFLDDMLIWAKTQMK